MGYNTHIIIGRLDSRHPLPERKKDLNKPYSDGSGFETLLDEEGNEVLTGRIRFYFHLCRNGLVQDLRLSLV